LRIDIQNQHLKGNLLNAYVLLNIAFGGGHTLTSELWPYTCISI